MTCRSCCPRLRTSPSTICSMGDANSGTAAPPAGARHRRLSAPTILPRNTANTWSSVLAVLLSIDLIRSASCSVTAAAAWDARKGAAMQVVRNATTSLVSAGSVVLGCVRLWSNCCFSRDSSSFPRDSRFCPQIIATMFTMQTTNVTCCTRFWKCTMLGISKWRLSGTVHTLAAWGACSRSRTPSVTTPTYACPHVRFLGRWGKCCARLCWSQLRVRVNCMRPRARAVVTYCCCRTTALGRRCMRAICRW
mmetsp:Transcript_45099/g.75960  ORF Transcript_45099/g.75960 Transcript_45099/m.75960 type:complete len:250 (+) Transcript_45099:892-1641(+)